MQFREVGRAELSVGGQKFSDWTSIWVQRTHGNPYDQFRFSCAERDGASASEVQSSGQFKPGDECTINMAGQRAFRGIIITRQCAYDGNSHAVQLSGTNATWSASTSSVIHDTNKFDGYKFREIAEEICKRAKAKSPQFDGTFPDTVYERCHVEKGETNFDFLARLAKNANVIITSTENGEFLFVGENPKPKNQGQLKEGENIEKMQAVISIEQARKRYYIDSTSNGRPTKGDDDKPLYQEATELRVVVEREQAEGDMYKIPERSILVNMEEIPSDDDISQRQDTAEQRGVADLMWSTGSELNATIEVYGWQPDGKTELWQPGAEVTVNSKMAMINQKMKIQSVTYTQDVGSGSKTTLVCVGPWSLQGGRPRYSLSKE